MKGVENIEESLEFGIMLSIVFGGLNALWGIFLLPLGIIGIIFALIDVIIAIYMKKIKTQYLNREYKYARNNLKNMIVIGIIFGFIALGIYIYLIYLALEDLIIKSHLIRDVKETLPLYGSPKIPIK